MALTTTTIFLTLAAGAGYKFFEAMRDYRKLQASTGHQGQNLFSHLPDEPGLVGVKFDLKLAGVCAAGAVVTLLAGALFSGSPKVVEVAQAKPAVELRGTTQPATATPPAASPVEKVVAPAKDERDTCDSQMKDMAASICVNFVYLTFGKETEKQWMADELKKNTLTCSRWEPKPYLTAGEISGKAVLAGFMSSKFKASDILSECYNIIYSGLSDHKPRLR